MYLKLPERGTAAARVRRARLSLGHRKTMPMPTEGITRAIMPAFQADGYHFKRPIDVGFIKTIRVANIARGTTTKQIVFRQTDLKKRGIIRWLGYEFNNPHGFFTVRTRILLGGGVPADFNFETIDESTLAGAGSFPPFQLGSITQPTPVFIGLSPGQEVALEFVNNATDEDFSAWVRLDGWHSGD